MRFKSDKAEIKRLLVQDIIITDEINKYVQEGIHPAAGSITEGLFRHEFAERGVKKINKRYNLLF